MRHSIYIRIKSSLLSVKDVTTGLLYEDVPLIALANPGKAVLQVGKAAGIYQNRADALVTNGFDAKRSIVGDFEAAEKTLQQFLKRIEPRRAWWQILSSVPIMVIHPLENIESGLTKVEARALEDLCWRARAADAYVWTGRILTDEEVRALRFPAEGLLHNR
jgi:rod shape-determining protein MreB and related proteins